MAYAGAVPDYSKIATYLAAHPGDRVTLTFDQVETMLGEPLPLAARVLTSWWGGASSIRYQQGQTWQAVGWRVTSIDLYAETVTFVQHEPARDT